MEKILLHLDDNLILPRDPYFPLSLAAAAGHDRVLAQIQVFINGLPKYTPVSADEFRNSIFDSRHRLIDSNTFFSRLYFAGIDPEVLRDALPFIFGLFPPESTEGEQNLIISRLVKEFDILCQQAVTISAPQLQCHKKLGNAFRVIANDVNRTDRSHVAFLEADGPGLRMISSLLRAYCLYDPGVGYLQGMNDLFVPIILVFFPKWDEQGNPIDEKGEIIDYQPVLPIIFGCFASMLEKTRHLGVLANVTDSCIAEGAIIMRLLYRVSPLLVIWLKRNGVSELLFMYSEFVLLFKRSYDDIWPVWLILNCSPCPADWLTYYVAAVLIKSFPLFAMAEECAGIQGMMSGFMGHMKQLDVLEVGKIAVWLYENFPLPEEDKKRNPELCEFESSLFHVNEI
jgi:hypothetical protein